MQQAAFGDCLSFDPFPFDQNGLAPPDVDVGGRQVADALVISQVIVVSDESLDLSFEIARQVMVLEQDTRLPAMAVAIFGMLVIILWWGVVWSLPVFCVLASVGGFVIGFEWTLGIVYVNEMFPTEIRATGFGWSVGLGRIVSIAAPIVTQTLAVTIGVAPAIRLSAFIWLSLILGYWLSHETRGTEIVDRVVKRPEMGDARARAGSGIERVGPRGLVRLHGSFFIVRKAVLPNAEEQ